MGGDLTFLPERKSDIYAAEVEIPEASNSTPEIEVLPAANPSDFFLSLPLEEKHAL